MDFIRHSVLKTYKLEKQLVERKLKSSDLWESTTIDQNRSGVSGDMYTTEDFGQCGVFADVPENTVDLRIVLKNAKADRWSSKCKCLEDRVVAMESIPKGTVLFCGKSILSYTPEEQLVSTYHIQQVLNDLPLTLQRELLQTMRMLYPRENEMMQVARNHFSEVESVQINQESKKSTLVVNEAPLLSQPEFEARIHAQLGYQIGVKLAYNFFRCSEKKIPAPKTKMHQAVIIPMTKPRNHLFVGGSKFNHACFINNCDYNLHESRNGMAVIQFVAIRDIDMGEECKISYMRGSSLPLSLVDRHAALLDLLGFTCSCEVCEGLAQACIYCKKFTMPYKKCARCLFAVYCSKRCQIAHWPIHKQTDCRIVKTQ